MVIKMAKLNIKHQILGFLSNICVDTQKSAYFVTA